MLNSRVSYFFIAFFIYILGSVQSYHISSTEDLQISDIAKNTISSNEEFPSEATSSEATADSTLFLKYPWTHLLHHTQSGSDEATSEQPEYQSETSESDAHLGVKITDNMSYEGSPTPPTVRESSPDESDITAVRTQYRNQTSRTLSSLTDILSSFNRNVTKILSSTLTLNISTTTENSDDASFEETSSISTIASTQVDLLNKTNIFHVDNETTTQQSYTDDHESQDNFASGSDSDIKYTTASSSVQKSSIAYVYFYPTIVSTTGRQKSQDTETTSQETEIISEDTETTSQDTEFISENTETTSSHQDTNFTSIYDIVYVSSKYVESTSSSPVATSVSSVHLVPRDKNETATDSSSVTNENFGSTSTDIPAESTELTTITPEEYSNSLEDVSTEEWFNAIKDKNKTYSKYEIHNKTLAPDIVTRVGTTVSSSAEVNVVNKTMTSPETRVKFTTEINRVSHEDMTSPPPRENIDEGFISVETTTRLQVVKSTVQNNVDSEKPHNSSDTNFSDEFSIVKSTTESLELSTKQSEHHADVTVPVIAGGVAILVLILVSVAIWLQGRRKRNNRRLRLRDRLVNSTKPKITSTADMPRFMVAMRQFPDHEVL